MLAANCVSMVCVPGRLPAGPDEACFDTITLKLWRSTASEAGGFWTTVIGESNQALYYFVVWDSLADREKKWNEFGADPGMAPAARAETAERAAPSSPT